MMWPISAVLELVWLLFLSLSHWLSVVRRCEIAPSKSEKRPVSVCERIYVCVCMCVWMRVL